MSATIEGVPALFIKDADWTQKVENAIDVGDWLQMSMMVAVQKYVHVSSNVAIEVHTALERTSERFVLFKNLVTLSASSSDMQLFYFSFHGPGEASNASPTSGQPALGRYILFAVSGMVSGQELAFDIKLLAREAG